MSELQETSEDGGFSTEQYFETQHAPHDLEARIKPAREFVERWSGVDGKKVVVVTVSGPDNQSVTNVMLTKRLHAERWYDGSSRIKHVRPTISWRHSMSKLILNDCPVSGSLTTFQLVQEDPHRLNTSCRLVTPLSSYIVNIR